MQEVIVAIDAGTTGIRSVAINHEGEIASLVYKEFTQYFPKPGWVEHDATEIWEVTQQTLVELAQRIDVRVVGIGIANQRETVVAWDPLSGDPLHRAIVWQDRRTTDICQTLKERGYLEFVRSRTGLVLDPYFSGTKLGWLFDQGPLSANDSTRPVAVGTVDSWLLYKLTGGAVHATEPSNASRTLLFDISEHRFSDELCEMFGVPRDVLPEVAPTAGEFGRTTSEFPFGPNIPIAAMAGDQQAALFGQTCLSPGDTKNTYGTGSFVLMNVGAELPEPSEGLLTSVAWAMPETEPTYCVEGAVFATGAAVQWLRDGLGIIERAQDLEGLASHCRDTGDLYFVPALAGLGSPYWDPNARGTIIGITRGTTRAHLARAVIEAMAFQTRDVVTAIESAVGLRPTRLRVDGGASVMDSMLQMQADQLNVAVERPTNQQTTVMGAGFLAGLAVGFWDSPAGLAKLWRLDRRFNPSPTDEGELSYSRWGRAVRRSLDWA